MSYFVFKNNKYCSTFECDHSRSRNCYIESCECSCTKCIHFNECMKNKEDNENVSSES